MAVDKLVDSAQLDSGLTSIANAIRTKGGTSAQMAFPAGFVSAVQAIPTGITPTGTKQISITQNGTTTEDVTQYADAEITVNVSGGGGISTDDIANGTAPSGAITLSSAVTTVAAQAFCRKPITSISGSAVTTVKTAAFQDCSSLTSATFPALTTIESNAFRSSALTSASFPLCTSVGGTAFEACQSLTSISLPSVTTPSNFAYNCQNLENVDLSACTTVAGGTFQQCYKLATLDLPACTKIQNNAFYNARILSTLILRNSSVVTLDNVGAFTNTPMRGYNSLSGTIYVPSALVSSYQTASNWSSLYSGGHCTFAAIEGSQYE